MKLRRDIKECEVIPKGYGVAWRYWDKLYVACYPIPLNLIVRVSIDIYYRLLRGLFPSRYEKELNKVYLNGLNKRASRKSRYTLDSGKIIIRQS